MLDFAKVEDYNQAMLDLQAELSFCGVDKFEQDMIEKTLNTFPSSMSLLAHQYRIEYENERVKTFSDLMNILQKKRGIMRLFSTIMQGRLRPRKFLKLIRLVVGKLQGKRKPIGQHLIHVGNLPHVRATKGTSNAVQTAASHGRGTAAPPPTTKEGAGPAMALVEVEICHTPIFEG